ncbi:MAG: NFACT family protein [Bacillota bacterium]
MGFDAIALAASLDEMNQLLGATITKIHTTKRSGEVVFSTRGRGSSGDLLVSIRRDGARIHLTRRHYEHPDHPGSFCMNLRKHILRARVQSFEQVGLDRIARIHLEARDELGFSRPLILVAETMGRNSNLLLVDPDDEDRILTAMRFSSADRNVHRSVLPGHPYRLPPQRKTIHPARVSVEDLSSLRDPEIPAWLNLVRNIDGPGPETFRRVLRAAAIDPGGELPGDEMTLRCLVRYINRIGADLNERNWEPWTHFEAPEEPSNYPRPGEYGFISSELPPEDRVIQWISAPSVLLDRHYALSDAIETMEGLAKELRRALESAKESARRKWEHRKKDLARADCAEEKRICGELLTTYMYMVPEGVEEIELPDYYRDGKARKIPLNSRLSPSQNAAQYFKDYRRLQRTEKKAKRQLRAAKREIHYIENLFYALDSATTLTDLQDLRTELEEAGYLKDQAPPRRRRRPSPQPKEYVLETGHRVLVGRNSRGNDHLTMRVASPNNLWFHVKDMAGSHVVLPGDWGEAEPPKEVLEEAAKVAARNSTARDSSNVPVDYTLVKHVSKPRGAHPGMVIYRNHKTLFVTP